MNQASILKAINIFSFKKKNSLHDCAFFWGQEVVDQEKVDFCIFLTFLLIKLNVGGTL
jgi:hypothetical protein